MCITILKHKLKRHTYNNNITIKCKVYTLSDALNLT